MQNNVDRILKERLDQFKVPFDVRKEIVQEILTLFQKPEKKPFGAAVMTPEASMAADQARNEKRTQGPGTQKPKVI